MQDKPKTKMRVGSLVRFRSHPDLGMVVGFRQDREDRPQLAEVKFLTNCGGNIGNVREGTYFLSQEGLEVIA